MMRQQVAPFEAQVRASHVHVLVRMRAGPDNCAHVPDAVSSSSTRIVLELIELPDAQILSSLEVRLTRPFVRAHVCVHFAPCVPLIAAVLA
jgi:hypothetical protein